MLWKSHLVAGLSLEYGAVGRGASAHFPRTVSTKCNVRGDDSESKKEATHGHVERASPPVTQGGTTGTCRDQSLFKGITSQLPLVT